MKQHSIYVENKNGITTVYHVTNGSDGKCWGKLFELDDNESGTVSINITGITIKGEKKISEVNAETDEFDVPGEITVNE
jgi:hypothetical protein